MKYITIEPGGGRFANQVLFYMAALAISRRIGGAVICGVGFAEWNIPLYPPPEGVPETYIVDRMATFDLDALAAWAAGKPSFNIILQAHMQDVTKFLPVAAYRRVFYPVHHDVPVWDDRHLLIHIRGGDILDGSWSWYPLTPIGFFQELLEKTGKLPVFMGELDEGAYVNALRAAFPMALFLPRQSVMRDFDMLRRAKNIVVCASTFSFVAAWLSEFAQKIHLPLNGFFNPAHMRHIDLLPVDDERFHFTLFPMNEAAPEAEALRLHEKMAGWWRDVSADEVRALKQAAPRAASGGQIALDKYWYLSAYMDAAMAISEGRYQNAEAHYEHLGRAAGYLPFAPLVMAPSPNGLNVTLGKPATQSSTWAGLRARAPEIDAAGAVDGDFAKEVGFHTAQETNPWWMVDLRGLHQVHEIQIYNRAGVYQVRARAAPLVLLVSRDGVEWIELLRTGPGELFGAERGPLCWRGAAPVDCRYVKVKLEKPREYLHLAQVAVFGRALEPPRPVIELLAAGEGLQLCRSGMKLPAKAVVLAHQRRRRRLVSVRLGPDAAFPQWFRPGEPRSWDVQLSFYKLPETPFSADVETVIAGGLSKFAAVKDVAAAQESVFDGYEQLLLLDDDVAFEFADIDRLFDLAAAYELDLAQASLTPDSIAWWPFLKHNAGTKLRYTDLVEVMMPVFSKPALWRCIETFDQSISSWGLDFVWSKLLGNGRNMAVIDAVVASHARPIDLEGGAFYRYLTSIGVEPGAEQMAVQQAYQVDRPQDSYGVTGEVRA